MPAPDFVVAGAPKCGTSALCAYLADHPQVFMAPIKEPNYFCHDTPALRVIDTAEAYARLFADARPDQLTGEGSTAYLASPVALASLLETNPAARVIVMVRNPVDMLVAHHSQKVYSFEETEADFEKAWRLSERRRRGEAVGARCKAPAYLDYKSMGRLGQQLERARQIVPPGQLHVIVFDDFSADPGAVYQAALAFLGLPGDDRRDFAVVNARKQHAWPGLARFLMKPPAALHGAKRALRRIFPRQARALGSSVHRLNERAKAKPAVPAALREEMMREFADDLTLLEQQLGRNLDAWRRPGPPVDSPQAERMAETPA